MSADDVQRIREAFAAVQSWVGAANYGKATWEHRDLIQMPLSTWRRLTHAINLMSLTIPAAAPTEAPTTPEGIRTRSAEGEPREGEKP